MNYDEEYYETTWDMRRLEEMEADMKDNEIKNKEIDNDFIKNTD